jgi:glycosidase
MLRSYLGTQHDWDNLVARATAKGIRIILDGVFNHLSSDSPFFDRYGHYSTVGACESVSSDYRDWFYFTSQLGGPCAGPDGPGTMDYAGWAGYDSIPVIHKDVPTVQEYFLTGARSIARTWLEAGASGWRLDVSSDPTFPNGYWETFRQVVMATQPDALTISETWQKDSTLLRLLRGDRLDTTMNYRFRDAVLGLLAPGLFDRKGFPASGAPTAPADFAARMLSQQEDYAPAAYDSLLNLLDSHDTERLLWTLTPGGETTAGRELDAANVAQGKQRMELASLIQFTVPGAPLIYYGDEVGMTGDDDPDDRRTYPWPDLGGTTDQDLLGRYQALAGLRSSNTALTDGDFRILLAGSNDEGTIAFGRRTDEQATITAINRSSETRTLAIPVAGFVPDATSFSAAYSVGADTGGSVTATHGVLTVELPPLGGALLVTGPIDLAPPAAPASLVVGAGSPGQPSLTWEASADAAGYNVYASPLSGGGYVRLNEAPVAGTSYADEHLGQHSADHYVVTALDAAGNESGWSNEVLFDLVN